MDTMKFFLGIAILLVVIHICQTTTSPAILLQTLYYLTQAARPKDK